ncbi:MAG: DUF456 domain-containing protein [Bacillota bacterium]
MEELVFWLVIIIMALGVLGTFLPVLPGAPLIFLAALGYGLYEGFRQVTPLTLVILFVLMGLTLLIDYLAGVVGAKKYGATRWGTWGAFFGGVLGVVFFSIVGLILGPLVGAIVGELLAGRKPSEALRVGLGTILGLAGGAVLKFVIALSMFILFLNKAL